MTAPSTQLTTRLTQQFGLTTAADEHVPRLTQAGHHDVQQRINAPRQFHEGGILKDKDVKYRVNKCAVR